MDCKQCMDMLKPEVSIKCVRCQGNFHHECIGLSEDDFKKMLPMNKAKWKCPNCKISKKIGQSSPQELTASQQHSILNVDANSLMSHFDERFKRLSSTIESFKTFITEELKKVTDTVKKWTERIVNIESSVKSVNERIDNFEVELCKIHSLQAELNYLKTLIKDLKESHSKNEQWVRRSNIQINGIPQKKGENLINIVKLLAERSNFKLCPDTDIDFVTRVATKNELDIKKPKPIIVKMQARYKKDDFLSSLRKLGSIKASDIGFPGVQNQIYVNDHLSTRNKALLREAKRLSKEKGYVYCWVRNCTIMVRRTDNSPVLHITSEESLKKIS
ncbi:uncharacterized protein LOC126779846 [Nymphalis io]|uniref:uncharacterized protein LOC126779846 n=1 Tax=Inachis io TaxID=171585 RepID=UPI00216A3A28|nr:uncharacterized protein LOC126779846 [Nymphalis io]